METIIWLKCFLAKNSSDGGPWITWIKRGMEMRKKQMEKREKLILQISSNPFSANYDQSPTWDFWPMHTHHISTIHSFVFVFLGWSSSIYVCLSPQVAFREDTRLSCSVNTRVSITNGWFFFCFLHSHGNMFIWFKNSVCF